MNISLGKSENEQTYKFHGLLKQWEYRNNFYY